jgi:ectoine hydroxylase-related dioxygenase (phytanoyl-CoA dioxygenase family)
VRNEKAYGVLERTKEPATVLETVLETLVCRGYAVLENALSSEQVTDLNERLETVYAKQCDEVGGENNLHVMGDADIVRLPLAYDRTFLDLALHPVITEAARRLIGPNVVLMMQNGVINRPDRIQAQSRWHRDLNYQHWVSSRPLAISAMVCLEDFTEETGGTIFLTGSHKIEAMPSEALLTAAAETPRVMAGSIVLFDSMIFHCTGKNRSGRVRRGINHVIGAPIMGQVIDTPRMLGGPTPTDPFVAGYLGYRWNPAESVAAWRGRKLDAIGRP